MGHGERSLFPGLAGRKRRQAPADLARQRPLSRSLPTCRGPSRSFLFQSSCVPSLGSSAPACCRDTAQKRHRGESELGVAISQNHVGIGAGSRNRTHDQRFTKLSESLVILLHHQLLTASAHLRHRGRMQRNARASNTALLRFRLQSHGRLGGCSAVRCEIDVVG